MKLSVQLIEGPEQLRAFAAESDRLALAARPRLPFATNAWLVLWWKHFNEDWSLVRDRFFVHTMRDEDGHLIALAPLILTERPGLGPLRVRVITFFGSDKNITELRGLVCAPKHEVAATRALLAHLTAGCREWDWFVWSGVRANAEAHQVLSETTGFAWCRQTSNHVLRLTDTWEKFRETRSRNIKESLRKCYNSLTREQLSFSLHVVDDATRLPAALERFFHLHALRARATHLADHADYFADSPAKRLLLGLASSPERVPALRVFELRIGTELVASRVGFELDDELYLYFSGFDPKWARYSVMTTTVAEVIKWAIARKLRVVNLSTGTDVSKTRWDGEVVTTCDGVLISQTRPALLKWELSKVLRRQARDTSVFSRFLWLARRRG